MNVLQATYRRQARAEKSVRDEQLIALHRDAALALSGPDAATVLANALSQISRWEAGKLCSTHYIDRWRSILAMEPLEAEKAMLQPDGDGPALRQNSPFGFLLRR